MVTYNMLTPEQSLEFLVTHRDWLVDFSRRSKEQHNWCHIEAKLMERGAVVVLAKKSGKTIGFMLLTEEYDLDDNLSLFVWIAYARTRLSRGDLELAIDYLDSLAKRLNAINIKFGTKRAAAWNRRLAKFKFFPALSVTFVREVK